MDKQTGSALAESPAEVYEDFLVRWQFRPWTAALLAEAGLQPGERILDLAAGTGIVAREAAPIVGVGGRVVAADVNPAMLAVGAALPPPRGAAIEWLEGDAARLPLSDGAFDAVLCQQGLQFFPDRPGALAETRRVLAPGGRVVFAVWQPITSNPVINALNEAARRHLGVGPMAAAFGLGDAGEAGSLFEAAGFAEVAVVPRQLVIVFPSREQYVRRVIEAVAQILPELAGLDAAGRAALVGAIEEDAGESLRTHAWGHGIAVPKAANLVTARTP